MLRLTPYTEAKNYGDLFANYTDNLMSLAHSSPEGKHAAGLVGVPGQFGEDRVGKFNAWSRRALCAGAAAAVMLLGVMAGSASAASPVTAPFTECPTIGAAPSCDILLVVNPDQSISVLGDSSVGPYDGSDDTLVGIVNNSSAAITAVTVSGPNSDLAGFDGDGICTYAAGSSGGSGFTGDSYCTAQQKAGSDPGDYAGPGTSFTLDPNSQDDVEVDFTGNGLAAGNSTYFSLEGALTAAVVKARKGGLNLGYIAMGDSYSSGEGAIDSGGNAALDPNTAIKGKDECHRSAHAYAYQLKAALKVSDSNFKFVACSGALLADFVAKVGLAGQWNEGAQLDAIAPAGNANPDIRLVTLSVGGNDAGFPRIMYNCVLGFKSLGVPDDPKSCISFADSTAAKAFNLLSNGGSILLHPDSDPKNVTWSFCTGRCLTWGPILHRGDIVVKVPSLADLYREIHKRAPNAKIRVMLYPELFPVNPPRDCTVGTFTTIAHVKHRYHLTQAEMTELNKLGTTLDNTISAQVTAAQQSGIDISAVDPNSPSGPAAGFSGHALCDSGAPWINGVIWDGNFLWDTSKFSFHPNALGQAEFGDLMQTKL